MIKNIVLIGIAVSLMAASFLLGQRYSADGAVIARLKPSDTTGDERFALSDGELQRLLSAARNGEIQAMRKVYFHYEFFEADHAEAEKWELAMANAGDTFSQHALIKNYLTAVDPVIRKEGAQLCSAWLGKAKLRDEP